MKNTFKRCISALLAAGTLLALAAPTAMAEDERRTPSGVKFEDLEKKFDDEFNFDKYATDPTEYYAGFEAVVFRATIYSTRATSARPTARGILPAARTPSSSGAAYPRP